MLCSKAKTRQLSDGCSGILRKVTPQACRAGGPQRNEMVCQRSCTSTWGHSSKLHGHAIPSHFFQTLDQAGPNFPCYQPGTHWCNKCPSEARRGSKPGQKPAKNPKTSLPNAVSKIPWRKVFLYPFFLYDAVLKETWRKTLILVYVLVLVIS